MKAALRLLLAPYRFSVDRLFRMGQDIGWHWQFDDPNTLYRRRNRLTYTGSYSSYWTLDNSGAVNPTVTPNYAVAPNGTTTAARLQLNKTGGSLSRLQHVLTFDPRQQTASLYARTTSGSGTANVGLRVGVGAGFNMIVTGEWQRFTYTHTDISVSDFQILLWDNIPGNDETADILIWGPQLEFGSTATEYQDVPTTWPQAYLDAVGAERIFAWTDTAGTIPVTAIGDGIGLLLGREYGGVRGAELLSNRSFENGATGWVATAPGVNTITISGGSARFQATGSADAATLVQVVALGANKVFHVEFDVLPGSSGQLKVLPIGGSGAEIVFSCTPGRKRFCSPVTFANSFVISRVVGQVTDAYLTNFSVREIPGTHLTQATGTAKPTLSARVNLLLNTAALSTQNVTTVATSYKLSFTGTGTVTLSGTSTAGPLVGTGANDRVSLTFTPTAGTLTLTVSGSVTLADLRTADDAAKAIPAYQRVGATAADHDTDGFPHFALADGTDDCWASVATVDGSATDKLTHVTAVTKASDAAMGVVHEHGATVLSNVGTVLFQTAAATDWSINAYAGTLPGALVASPYAAPKTSVVAGVFDIASDLRQVHVDGVQKNTSNTDFGSGNFANATLYVLSRAGSSLRFNGRFYGSTGRFGPMGDSERNNLTRWWQKRIGTA